MMRAAETDMLNYEIWALRDDLKKARDLEAHMNKQIDELEVSGGNAEEGRRVLEENAALREALAAEREKNKVLNRLLLNEGFEHSRLRQELNKQ